jgi:hypothetical protein
MAVTARLLTAPENEQFPLAGERQSPTSFMVGESSFGMLRVAALQFGKRGEREGKSREQV